MSLDELNRFMADKFPEVFRTLTAAQGRDPSYRFYQHKRTRYCWNTEPMNGKKPYATWKEQRSENRIRRYAMIYFARRKVAKARAFQRYKAASVEGLKP